jgi:hypothetical protein
MSCARCSLAAGNVVCISSGLCSKPPPPQREHDVRRHAAVAFPCRQQRVGRWRVLRFVLEPRRRDLTDGLEPRSPPRIAGLGAPSLRHGHASRGHRLFVSRRGTVAATSRSVSPLGTFEFCGTASHSSPRAASPPRTHPSKSPATLAGRGEPPSLEDTFAKPVNVHWQTVPDTHIALTPLWLQSEPGIPRRAPETHPQKQETHFQRTQPERTSDAAG